MRGTGESEGAATTGPGIALVGAEHLHLFEIVDALVRAGARTVAHVPDGSLVDAYASWRTDSEAASLEEILADETVEAVVTVGVPSERAAVAVAAIEAGKAVVGAKPGVTTEGQLEDLRRVLRGRPGRPWTVVFTEHFANRAVSAAIELARSGAVGEVVRVRGVGPHTLAADSRPGWFFDPTRSGGILVDLASHQIHEFLTLCGDPAEVVVVDASVGNVASPDHAGFSDIGSLTLVADGIDGHLGVDLLSPAGLGTWGDVRLEITGTGGTLEVRANIDVTGRPGADHLIHVDADGARRIDVSGVTVDWASVLLEDLRFGTERLMTQDHVFAVAELALTARSIARPWGTPAAIGERA